MSDYILINGELYHYGILGMKWGRRKYYDSNGSLNSAGEARQNYKNAKKELKSAAKQFRKDSRGFGIKALAKSEQARKKYNAAAMNTINAKAKFNAAKASNSTKAQKAEFKTYSKEMSKTGLAGSERDRRYDNRSTRIYNDLIKKKGKAYADKVQKSVQNRLVVDLVGSAAVMIGVTAVKSILEYS